MSQILNERQIKAVRKIGNVICPGSENLPRFSSVNFESHIDIVLKELPPNDLGDLKLLLSILSFMPSFILKMILLTLELLKDIGTPIGGLIRMIRFGLRGIIFSVYYSTPEAHKGVGFQVKVIKD
jgi:hypothetical protein